MVDDRPWHVRRADRLEHVCAVAARLQPELFCVVDEDVAYLRGPFLVHHKGKLLHRYEIEIEFPHDYDRQLAIVRETGGRIPRIDDRHVNSDGTACLYLEDEFWYDYPDGVDFETFLGSIVSSFFQAQRYYELEERWLYGERAHHVFGLLDFYHEVLGKLDLPVIISLLGDVASNGPGHRNRPCPCGSGKKLRHCHQEALRKLKSSLPKDLVQRRVVELQKLSAALRTHAEQEQKA